ncbi:hypothetical protein JCM18899A_03660 [Nocardioides sp. AN3]
MLISDPFGGGESVIEMTGETEVDRQGRRGFSSVPRILLATYQLLPAGEGAVFLLALGKVEC